MSPVTFQFIVDCADVEALRTLCAAPLPPGIRARCVSCPVLRAGGPGRLWRALVSVRRGTHPGLVAAWLRSRLGACATAWSVDGIPVTADRGPHPLQWRPTGLPAAVPGLATRRA